MRSSLVSTLAIVAASIAAPIDDRVNDLAVRSLTSNLSYFVITNLIGGSGGNVFAGPSSSDLAALSKMPELPNITSFSIRGINANTYGGTGGNLATLQLKEGEFINEVQVQLGGRNSRRQMNQNPDPGETDGNSLVIGWKNFYDIQKQLSPLKFSTDSDSSEYNPPSASDGVPATSESNGVPDRPDTVPTTPDTVPATPDTVPATLDAPLVKMINRLAVGEILSIIVVGGTVDVVAGIKNRHSSKRLYFIRITTNLGRSLQQGMPDGKLLTFTPLAGYTKLIGFVGRSGDEVDAIAPVWG